MSKIRASTKRHQPDWRRMALYEGVHRDEQGVIIWRCHHRHTYQSQGYDGGSPETRSALRCAELALAALDAPDEAS